MLVERPNTTTFEFMNFRKPKWKMVSNSLSNIANKDLGISNHFQAQMHGCNSHELKSIVLWPLLVSHTRIKMIFYMYTFCNQNIYIQKLLTFIQFPINFVTWWNGSRWSNNHASSKRVRSPLRSPPSLHSGGRASAILEQRLKKKSTSGLFQVPRQKLCLICGQCWRCKKREEKH